MVRATGTKMWAWGAVAALTLGMVGIGSPATAAPPDKSSAPAATAASAVQEDGSVTFTYKINRAAKLGNPTVTCTLVNTATHATTTLDGCGTPSPSKKATEYRLTTPFLADGEYEFTVTLTLTDGGTATASAPFTIAAAAQLQAACTDVMRGLLYFSSPEDNVTYIWQCTQYPLRQSDAATELLTASWIAALQPFCPRTLDWSLASQLLARVNCPAV